MTTISCGTQAARVTIPGTILTSPNYPNYYDNNLECTTVVRFPPGELIQLEFLDFELESGSDWLEIRDGDNAYANQIGSRLSGVQNPGSIISSGNALYLHFLTDGSVKERGFKIKAVVAGKIRHIK